MPPEATTQQSDAAAPVDNTPPATSGDGGSAGASENSNDQGDLFAGLDLSSMTFDGDDTGTPKSEPKPAEPAPAAPAATTPPVATPPAAPAATPPQAATPPAQAPAPAAATTPPEQQQQQDQPDPYLKALQDNQDKALGELQKYYTMDEKAAERFEQEPMKFLSEMAARLHLAVLQNTYSAVLTRLPELSMATLQQHNTYTAAEDQFFKAWDGVFDRNNQDQLKVLATYGQMFRSQNPNASAEEFTKYVGAAAMAHLGLKKPTGKGNGQRRPVPHTPAAAGGGAPPAGGEPPKLDTVGEMFELHKAGAV